MKNSRIIAVVAITACGMAASAAAQTASTTTDAAAVYKAFLLHWRGKNHDAISVARSAKPVQPDSDGDCDGHPDIQAILARPTERIDDLSSVLGPDPSIHFIEPGTWHPTDPQDLIDQGKPVDKAVDSGMAAGLLTFSAIAFNESHDTAVFGYGFTCGSLCGTGGIVIMRKKGNAWVNDARQCATWMSQTWPPGRPNPLPPPHAPAAG